MTAPDRPDSRGRCFPSELISSTEPTLGGILEQLTSLGAILGRLGVPSGPVATVTSRRDERVRPLARPVAFWLPRSFLIRGYATPSPLLATHTASGWEMLMLRHTLALSLAVLMPACSDSTGPEGEIWGEYDYASVELVPFFTDDDSLATRSEVREGRVTLDPDGGTYELWEEQGISWGNGDITDIELHGARVRFILGAFQHEGEVDGRMISGTWESLPCPPDVLADCISGEGSFTARRR